jgi:hypothetical protein
MAGYMEKWCGMILDFLTKREGIMKKSLEIAEKG